MNRKIGVVSGQALLAMLFAGAAGCTGAPLAAQEPNPTAQTQGNPDSNAITQPDGAYLYRVKVVEDDLDAGNYLHRSGSRTIGFKGTILIPWAKGTAKVTIAR